MDAAFDESLNKLGNLYEEGKICLHKIGPPDLNNEDYWRLFEILRELRDIAAVQMQNIHWKNEN